jgi:hypothetical protein
MSLASITINLWQIDSNLRAKWNKSAFVCVCISELADKRRRYALFHHSI